MPFPKISLLFSKTGAFFISYGITCSCYYLVFPWSHITVIRFGQIIDAFLPEAGQVVLIGKECTAVHDSPGSLSAGIQDEHTPAPIIPAYLRPCQVDAYSIPDCPSGDIAGTDRLQDNSGKMLLSEKRLCLSGSILTLIFFSGILVIDQELEFAPCFLDDMDLSHVMTAFTALLAFEHHRYSPLPDTLPDCEPEFKGNQDDDHPLEQV